MTTLSTRVAGIPCQIEVTHYLRVKPFNGSPHLCDNPDDYYGYTECEFQVLDTRGHPAPWLESKLTQDDRSRIEGEVRECMETDDRY